MPSSTQGRATMSGPLPPVRLDDVNYANVAGRGGVQGHWDGKMFYPATKPVASPATPLRRTNQLEFIKSTVMKAIKAKSKDQAWFAEPVDVVKFQVPQYYRSIPRPPMDLKTIKARLDNLWYMSAKEAERDFENMFDNAIKFNGKSTKPYKAAVALRNILHHELVINMPKPEVASQVGGAAGGASGGGYHGNNTTLNKAKVVVAQVASAPRLMFPAATAAAATGDQSKQQVAIIQEPSVAGAISTTARGPPSNAGSATQKQPTANGADGASSGALPLANSAVGTGQSQPAAGVSQSNGNGNNNEREADFPAVALANNARDAALNSNNNNNNNNNNSNMLDDESGIIDNLSGEVQDGQEAQNDGQFQQEDAAAVNCEANDARQVDENDGPLVVGGDEREINRNDIEEPSGPVGNVSPVAVAQNYVVNRKRNRNENETNFGIDGNFQFFGYGCKRINLGHGISIETHYDFSVNGNVAFK